MRLVLAPAAEGTPSLTLGDPEVGLHSRPAPIGDVRRMNSLSKFESTPGSQSSEVNSEESSETLVNEINRMA